MPTIVELARRARQAALELAVADTETKNRALQCMAEELLADVPALLSVNRADVDAARQKKLSSAFIERMTLNETRVAQMAEGLRAVAALPDPVGETPRAWVRPSGLRIAQRRVPIGVIGIIYESRPNVTVDATALCVKSGNAVLLRGGSDALASNIAVARCLTRGARMAGLPEGSVALVEDPSREVADEMMRLHGLIDVLIPRGGKGLIHAVVQNARVPVIQTGDGVCHIYVDRGCDEQMALAIAVTAKTSRPSTCNAAETLLVDEAVAESFLPGCLRALIGANVRLVGCERARALCPDIAMEPASEESWETEYNDLIYNVKIVGGVDEAVAHINAHGTRHSEAIVTRDLARARLFQDRVDAAAVYVNASTRFTDGGEFGFGAEIGISNQKLHARGPMGLNELTTIKYVIEGQGQTR